MTFWYQNNQRLYRNERAALSVAQSRMNLEIRQAGFRINQALSLKRECAVAAGTYVLNVPESDRRYDYCIAVVLPDNYPKAPCVVYCDDPKLPIGDIERHIMSDGQACLAVTTELRQRWNPTSGIVGFLEEFVAPFLAWQVFDDAYGYPPPWGQRSHGCKGIVEFYADILGLPADFPISAFMLLLARKNPPKGHETCPCGSERHLRHCHAATVKRVRELVAWQAVRSDLATFDRIKKHVWSNIVEQK